jgi:antitoxin component YwqK of YwqJK toxin-antitoxin module
MTCQTERFVCDTSAKGTNNVKTSSEGSFKNGKENGRFIAFYPNGKKEFEKNYINGLETGTFKKWTKDGMLETMQVYENGQLVNNKKYTSSSTSP